MRSGRQVPGPVGPVPVLVEVRCGGTTVYLSWVRSTLRAFRYPRPDLDLLLSPWLMAGVGGLSRLHPLHGGSGI